MSTDIEEKQKIESLVNFPHSWLDSSPGEVTYNGLEFLPEFFEFTEAKQLAFTKLALGTLEKGLIKQEAFHVGVFLSILAFSFDRSEEFSKRRAKAHLQTGLQSGNWDEIAKGMEALLPTWLSIQTPLFLLFASLHISNSSSEEIEHLIKIHLEKMDQKGLGNLLEDCQFLLNSKNKSS